MYVCVCHSNQKVVYIRWCSTLVVVKIRGSFTDPFIIKSYKLVCRSVHLNLKFKYKIMSNKAEKLYRDSLSHITSHHITSLFLSLFTIYFSFLYNERGRLIALCHSCALIAESRINTNTVSTAIAKKHSRKSFRHLGIASALRIELPEKGIFWRNVVKEGDVAEN